MKTFFLFCLLLTAAIVSVAQPTNITATVYAVYTIDAPSTNARPALAVYRWPQNAEATITEFSVATLTWNDIPEANERSVAATYDLGVFSTNRVVRLGAGPFPGRTGGRKSVVRGEIVISGVDFTNIYHFPTNALHGFDSPFIQLPLP